MTDRPTPEVRDEPDRNRFVAEVDGQHAGLVEYLAHGDRVVITHTEVEDAFEGQGVASATTRQVLDTLRQRGQTVVPRCPYTARWIERHEDYQDLLAG